jgi:hypothetical protein
MTMIQPAPGTPFPIDTRLMSDKRVRPWVTASIVATVAAFTVGLGYVLNEGIFAPLSDLGAVAFAVTLLPVAWYLHSRFRRADPGASATAVAVGMSGLVIGAVSGALLALLHVIRTDPATNSLPILEAQHLGIFLQGAWMLGIGALGLRQKLFRKKTSLGAVVAGVGYMVGAPISLWVGFDSPVFYLAFGAGLAGFLTWALSLRNDLTSDARETS